MAASMAFGAVLRHDSGAEDLEPRSMFAACPRLPLPRVGLAGIQVRWAPTPLRGLDLRVAMKQPMKEVSQLTLGLATILLVAGAILYFAVGASVAGVSLNAVGLILMIGGALAGILSFATPRSRPARPPGPEQRPFG